MKSVFEILDERNDTYFGIQPFNIMRNIRVWRQYFALCVIVAAGCWVFFGFDSTWSQMTTIIKYIPDVLFSQMPISEVFAQSRLFYGVGNHFSAPVIYGLFYIALSYHLESIGIYKSENFSITTLLSLSAIGIFEIAYNICYATFQGQPWVITFKYKQLANLIMFMSFSFVGFIGISYMYVCNYKLNFSKLTQLLLVLSIAFWALWIYYPFPITHLAVETAAGTWHSTSLFPQTYYAIDINEFDNIAIGQPFYVNNDLLHLINTTTKIVCAAFMLSLFKYKKVENYTQIESVELA